MNTRPTDLKPGFGLAGRIFAGIALLCLVFTAVSLWQWRQLDEHMSELRAEAEGLSAAHLDGILTLDQRRARSFTETFSWWDDLVDATRTRDLDWLARNLDPVTSDALVDAVAVVDRDGHLVHAGGLAPAEGAAVAAAVGPARRGRDGKGLVHVRLADGPADVAFAGIIPTADAKRVTEPHGSLVAVLRWSPRRLADLSQLFVGTVALSDHAETEPGSVSVVRKLTGTDGAAIATVVATRRIPAVAAMSEHGIRHVWTAAIVAVAGSGMLLAAIIVLVGLPLRRLARAAHIEDSASARAVATRNDELGAVAMAVGHAIEQRRRLAAEVAQRQGAEAGLREANDRLQADLASREAAERARREAEMRTSLALQGGNLCLWELVLAERRWSVDRGWLAFLGITLDPTVPDSDAWDAVIDPTDLGTLNQRMIDIISGEIINVEVSFRLRRDDGGIVWVLLRGTVAERDEAGTASRLVGTMLDVTHWRELEQQLRQAQKLESIGQLAAGIAHEINTPIQFVGDNARFSAESFATLMGLVREYRGLVATDPAMARAAEAAEDRADFAYLAEEIPKSIDQSLEGVARVATIVRAMKEFAHPGAAELAPSDLNHLVENAVTISRSTWRYVADLDLVLDPALPPVPLSAGDFNQVLLNLIVNAAQAIEDAQAKEGKARAGRIGVSTARDGDHAVLRVSDNGCGIPAEIRERVFDPFFTTKQVGRGSGQGLTIARSVVVERHHGQISFETEAGVGTTFIVRLPLTAAE